MTVGKTCNDGATCYLFQTILITKSVLQLFYRWFTLQVGLTIKVLRLNVACTFWSRRIQQDEISREELILLYLANRTSFNFLPLGLLKHTSRIIVDFHILIILFVVSSMSFEIFISIFKHRHGNNKYQRQKHGRLPITDTDRINHLHERDD